MTNETRRETLDILACEIEVRPKGAPGIDALAPHIVSARRDAGAIVVSFAADASRDVEAFVAAEQQCCATLGWDLSRQGEALQLTITAQPQQLDVLERLFAAQT